MIVIRETTEIIYLKRNQICILCQSEEKMPEIFQIDGFTYRPSIAAGIPIEYSNKGYLKGSILEHYDCVIYGVEQAEDFKKIILIAEELPQKVLDIWNNPEKYSTFKKGSEEAFYHFLKFIWIKFPNGEENRLVDRVVK